MAPAGLVEVERTEHDAVIGQGEGRHAISRRLREEVVDPGRAVEQRELAVGVQVNEAVPFHRLTKSLDRPRGLAAGG